MKPFFRVRFLKRTFTSFMQIFGIVVFILYVVIPVAFRYVPAFQRHMIFLPFLRWPTGVNFSDPQSQGVYGTRNLYIETEPSVTVGVWHSMPEALISKKYERPEDSLAEGYPILLYLHGNSGSRVNSHRIELYKILQSLDYHVITLDYRGYADSSQDVLMSEDGAVTDAMAVYHYIRKHSKESKITVWGHSLGTGIATRTVAQLVDTKLSPDRLILEAPFNNIADEVRHHPLAQIFSPFPVFDWFFTEPLVKNNLAFNSDIHIGRIDIPILMLHAQDDAIIPIKLARMLFEAAQQQRPSDWPPVQLIEFHYDYGYGHKYICRAPELPAIVHEFIDSDWHGKKSASRLIDPTN